MASKKDNTIIDLDSPEIVFGSGKDALKALDVPRWHVEEGDQVAIFGPSGSGESTFLHALVGLLPASSGRLTVCGHSLGLMSEAKRDSFRAQDIGYIYQNFNLLQGFTALEYVR